MDPRRLITFTLALSAQVIAMQAENPKDFTVESPTHGTTFTLPEAKGEFGPALFPIDEELRLPDTDYAVAFWFKTTAKDVRLCEAKRYSSYNNRWSDHIVSLEGGKVRFQLQGDQALETPGTFNDGQWHHVVTTVGPGGQRLHMDGTRIATGKLTQRTKTSNRLGLDLGPGGGNASVTIDELRIFGHALTETEVIRLSD